MSYPYRYAPGAEVSGAIMSAVFNHYRRDEVIDSLTAHELDYFDADKWYPVDQFVDLLKEWSLHPSFTSNYVSVGMAMIYHIELSDDLQALDSVAKLLKLGEFFMAQHRGQGIGAFSAEAVSPSAIVYTESTVWPDDIIYGYIYGAVQRYLGLGKHFVLSYADDHQHQDKGGSSTVLHLTIE